MNIQFHPAAEEEFSAAIDWYETREKGLDESAQKPGILEIETDS